MTEVPESAADETSIRERSNEEEVAITKGVRILHPLFAFSPHNVAAG
jgi:hypothetical protein